MKTKLALAVLSEASFTTGQCKKHGSFTNVASVFSCVREALCILGCRHCHMKTLEKPLVCSHELTVTLSHAVCFLVCACKEQVGNQKCDKYLLSVSVILWR